MYGEAPVINFKMICSSSAFYETEEAFYRVYQAFTEEHPLFTDILVSVGDPDRSEEAEDEQVWKYPVSVKLIVEGEQEDAEQLLEEQINPMIEDIPPSLSNMTLQMIDIKIEKILHLPKQKARL